LARTMPFVDGGRIALVGGSAGGYAALMVAADAFPLAGIAPFVPPLNLAYTMAYLQHAGKVAGCPESFPSDPEGWQEFSRQLQVPVVCYVQSIVRDLEALLGPWDANADNWHRACPLAVWPLITCPVLLAYSTADVLVPMQQLDARWVQAADLSEFPAGYSFDFEVVLPKLSGASSLAEVIDTEAAETFVVRVSEELPAVWEEVGEDFAAPAIEAPFSEKRQVSLVILDEGPPQPRATHVKRRFRFSDSGFLRWCLSRPLAEEQLTPAKLERLMRRMAGEEADGLLDCRGSEPKTLRRRSSPARERADVLLGLKAYVEAGDRNAERLAAMYGQLPAYLRVLDERGAPFEADVRGNLRRALGALGLGEA
jgi:dienelactone hydrolase